jgi:hypothetical protein
MKKKSYLFKIILLSFLINPAISMADTLYNANDTILIYKPLSSNDTRYEYPEILLKKIIEVTETEYWKASVQHSKSIMKRDRAFVSLIKGSEIHVMAEAPKPGWESKLIPVRIPIRKGVQGFRTFLILKQNQTMLSQINTIEELQKIPTGSGVQWSTTAVLEKNGFNVVTGTDYEGLFKMLTKGRFITFGRGINETPVEFEQRKDLYPDLAIEKDLLLYIPLPTYFFVSPKRPELAERIEKGLNTLIDDGSFDVIFNQYFGKIIKDANLSERKMLKINNPNLSAETPLEVEKYWYQP